MREFPFLLIFVTLLQVCKPVQQTSTGSQGGKYHEDLSAYRPSTEALPVKEDTSVTELRRDPKAYVEPSHTANAQVDAVLDSIDRINLSRKFIDGFTIQVYSGLLREDALAAKKEMTTYLPDLESEVQYVQPNFRVKTGKYYSRLEAQKDYLAVKRYFPSAIVVPDKIPNK